MRTHTTADRLNQIMAQRNLSQTDIINMCMPYCEKYNEKMNKSTLNQYVTGRNEPRQNKLTILSLALGVSEVWLMGYDVPMERVSSPTIANNGNMTIGDSNYIGNEIHANTPLKMDYTEDEKELVEMYRKLSIINRAKVITYIAELGENNGQK